MNYTTDGAEDITEYICRCFSKEGRGNMWRGKAFHLLLAVMGALIYMRDNFDLEIDDDIVKNYLDLKYLPLLTTSFFPENIAKPIEKYLCSLPGYQMGHTAQKETTLDSHGYVAMIITHALNNNNNS